MNSTIAPKVGDILVGSYGYEASISTFAKVVAVGAATVKVRELNQRRAYKDCMHWTSTPIDNDFIGAVVTKRVKAYENGYRVKWSSYQNLYLGDLSPRDDYNEH